MGAGILKSPVIGRLYLLETARQVRQTPPLRLPCSFITEGRRKKEEGRRKKEEGRRKKEEGRRKKEEGRRKKEELTWDS
jgi:hypothetical protein